MSKDEDVNNTPLSKNFNSRLLDSIILIENILEEKNIKTSINIELEGVYLDDNNLQKDDFYQKVNSNLKKFEIKAKLKPEFWEKQWEYESDFQIGNTIQTIQNYQKFCKNINQIFYPQIPKIKPVNYKWCQLKDKVIHLPNAVQINISLWKEGFNMLANKNFAFFLQNLLIKHSIDNLIFFLPNQESLDRLFLKEKYNLQDKLMSPSEISGGTKGSIAYYFEKNKKGLPNNLNLNFDDLNYKISDQQSDFQKNSRIEFRLASASLEYNLQLHILFVMLVMLESIILYEEDIKYNRLRNVYELPKKFYHDKFDNIVSRYEAGLFFDKKINLFLKEKGNKNFAKLIGKLNQISLEIKDLIKSIIN